MTPIDALQPGDTIVVRPGEVVPADSTLLDEGGAIDYAFVTGESRAHELLKDAVVSAGGRVVGRALRLSVIRPVSQGRLADLWNHPVFARAKTHWLATVSSRFGWWFTAGAVGLALVGAVLWWPDAGMSLQVATAVLIIACPCALTLAAPIALGTAMGQLGRSGCYLKHPAVALDLARINTIVFDKTGTLTTAAGDAGIVSSGFTLNEYARLRRLAAESVHPISRAIVGHAPVTGTVSAVCEEAGRGLKGLVDGERVAIGTAEFISSLTGDRVPHDDRTWAVVGRSRPGWVRVEATDREGIPDAIRRLSRSVHVSLYSGDGTQHLERWRHLFGRHIRFRMTPEAKLSAIRRRQARGRRVLMVGDGLNDAGALAGADVGLAVSDDTACLVPACDGVIRGDRVRFLPKSALRAPGTPRHRALLHGVGALQRARSGACAGRTADAARHCDLDARQLPDRDCARRRSDAPWRTGAAGVSVIVLLIVAGGVVAVGFLGAFVWAVRSGQFDDTETPPVRMLFDDHP